MRKEDAHAALRAAALHEQKVTVVCRRPESAKPITVTGYVETGPEDFDVHNWETREHLVYTRYEDVLEVRTA